MKKLRYLEVKYQSNTENVLIVDHLSHPDISLCLPQIRVRYMDSKMVLLVAEGYAIFIIQRMVHEKKYWIIYLYFLCKYVIWNVQTDVTITVHGPDLETDMQPPFPPFKKNIYVFLT